MCILLANSNSFCMSYKVFGFDWIEAQSQSVSYDNGVIHQ